MFLILGFQYYIKILVMFQWNINQCFQLKKILEYFFSMQLLAKYFLYCQILFLVIFQTKDISFSQLKNLDFFMKIINNQNIFYIFKYEYLREQYKKKFKKFSQQKKNLDFLKNYQLKYFLRCQKILFLVQFYYYYYYISLFFTIKKNLIIFIKIIIYWFITNKKFWIIFTKIINYKILYIFKQKLLQKLLTTKFFIYSNRNCFELT
eukprot:TRINITY_DN4741_c0_g1_i2.p4 TRINITY_DN4741_c0_g1~~TRINITY_DN4741_c0_g1_i2.p4  ORF type:complete len:206 (-),score=-14.81 TRINITY_DN4741_c0_g1_i2:495-1112(-)